jgi:hypothetical protein
MFGAVVVVGLALRLARYLRRDSLWGDEAMLAGSIAGRSFHALIPPLDYGQLAPIPFLWLERAIVAAFGPGELALRAVPLLAACALLILFLPFARELLTELEALVALGLVATSGVMIRYSSELKPYTLDALAALLLVWSALRVRRAPGERAAWARLALAGVLTPLISTPAVFVLAAVAVALGLELLRHDERRRLALLALIVCVGLGAAGAAYWVWYRDAAGNAYMRDFWQAALLRPGTVALPTRFMAGVEETLEPSAVWLVAIGGWWFLLGLVAVGAAGLRRREGPAAMLLLVLPVGFAFAASALGIYPVALRLMLFASPLVICLLAAGVTRSAAWLHHRVPGLRAGVLAVAMLIPSTELAIRDLIAHPQDEEMRPLVTALEAKAGGEPVYVFHRCIPAWSFYTTDWARPDTARTRWMATEAGPGGPAHENGESRGHRPPGEGAALIRSTRGRVELLGLASGIRGRQWLGYEPPIPDAGWSANEAARIRAAAAPGIWLVLINAAVLAEGDTLVAAVEDRGGVPRDSIVVPGGKALRMTFE